MNLSIAKLQKETRRTQGLLDSIKSIKLKIEESCRNNDDSKLVALCFKLNKELTWLRGSITPRGTKEQVASYSVLNRDFCELLEPYLSSPAHALRKAVAFVYSECGSQQEANSLLAALSNEEDFETQSYMLTGLRMIAGSNVYEGIKGLRDKTPQTNRLYDLLSSTLEDIERVPRATDID
jgi:hypothetical protein